MRPHESCSRRRPPRHGACRPSRCWGRSAGWPARHANLRLAGEADATEQGSDLQRLGLTDREVEVLRHLADGRSNKQIGQRLFISTKTVSVHVSNILAKLGVASRGEAAATAHRLRVFDPDPSDRVRS